MSMPKISRVSFEPGATRIEQHQNQRNGGRLTELARISIEDRIRTAIEAGLISRTAGSKGDSFSINTGWRNNPDIVNALGVSDDMRGPELDKSIRNAILESDGFPVSQEVSAELVQAVREAIDTVAGLRTQALEGNVQEHLVPSRPARPEIMAAAAGPEEEDYGD